MDIQAKIHNYILKRSKKFTVENMINSTFKNSKESKRSLEDYLDESLYLFSSDEDNNPEKQYIPRSSFFKNAEIVVTPSDYEIKKGILFIGHRFIPLYPFDIFPAESFSIKFNKTEIIGTKSIKYKLEDLYTYYSLLGAENIIDDITADHVDNYNLIGNPSQKVNITVFDFKKFYDENSFKTGMSLKFKLNDWNNSDFYVSVNDSIISEEEKNIWFELLEDSLHRVFKEKGEYFDIPEQLSLAYFYSGTSLLKSPPCSIFEFLSRNENIAVKFVEDNTILWYAENNEPSLWTGSNDVISISNGTLSSINDILEELKSELTSTELEAFIKDSLYLGIEDYKIILDKCIPNFTDSFKDKAQETAFLNHFEELWENISKNYNPHEGIISNLRTDILDTLESFYKIRIENEEDSENPEYYEIKKHIIEIREILNLLNNSEHDINAEEVLQIEELASNHLNSINQFIDYSV